MTDVDQVEGEVQFASIFYCDRDPSEPAHVGSALDEREREQAVELIRGGFYGYGGPILRAEKGENLPTHFEHRLTPGMILYRFRLTRAMPFQCREKGILARAAPRMEFLVHPSPHSLAAGRNPISLVRVSGAARLRKLARRKKGAWNQEPPRSTRSSPVAGPGAFSGAGFG